jgi:hypothetical protein
MPKSVSSRNRLHRLADMLLLTGLCAWIESSRPEITPNTGKRATGTVNWRRHDVETRTRNVAEAAKERKGQVS